METRQEYVASKLQRLQVMDKKIAALTQCIHRLATSLHGPLHLQLDRRGGWFSPYRHPHMDRFVALWKAKNRRTRVLMRRAMREAAPARYEVHAIADADCTRVREEVLWQGDSLDHARARASHAGGVYGAAVVDTETGAIDFGV